MHAATHGELFGEQAFSPFGQPKDEHRRAQARNSLQYPLRIAIIPILHHPILKGEGPSLPFNINRLIADGSKWKNDPRAPPHGKFGFGPSTPP